MTCDRCGATLADCREHRDCPKAPQYEPWHSFRTSFVGGPLDGDEYMVALRWTEEPTTVLVAYGGAFMTTAYGVTDDPAYAVRCDGERVELVWMPRGTAT